MLTSEVRVSKEVNEYVWHRGIRNIPRRVRVRLVRKKNESEEGQEQFYTEVKLIKVRSFKNLVTENTTDK